MPAAFTQLEKYDLLEKAGFKLNPLIQNSVQQDYVPESYVRYLFSIKYLNLPLRYYERSIIYIANFYPWFTTIALSRYTPPFLFFDLSFSVLLAFLFFMFYSFIFLSLLIWPFFSFFIASTFPLFLFLVWFGLIY